MALVARKIRNPEGHETTIRMAAEFWSAVTEIQRREDLSRNQVIARAARIREDGLTEAVRIYVLRYFRRLVAQLEGRQP